jgi:hypothetical protein
MDVTIMFGVVDYLLGVCGSAGVGAQGREKNELDVEKARKPFNHFNCLEPL